MSGDLTPTRNTNFCLIQCEHQKQGETPKHSLSSNQAPETAEEVSLPDLAVGRRCLCDDRAGLGWRHGLLNHNAGVMVGHPGAAKLVSSGPCHGPTNCVMHRDILPREDRRKVRRSQCLIVLLSSQRMKLRIWSCQLSKELWLLARHESICLVITYNYKQMKNNYLP